MTLEKLCKALSELAVNIERGRESHLQKMSVVPTREAQRFYSKRAKISAKKAAAVRALLDIIHK